MINILIPAAGNGQRFKDAGYEQPKPMIDVAGKPMILRVIDNLRPTVPHVVTVIQQRPELMIGVHKILLDEPTEGAVDTLLKAKPYVAADDPLIIANCDQLVDFDIDDFISKSKADGSLVVFKSNKGHHSYVVERDGIITDIAEKEVISSHAVTGVYYFKHAADFFRAAEWAMQEDIRFKNEFYVSTAIASMITEGKEIGIYEAPSAMLGTPEELQLFELAVKVGRTL